MNYKIIIDPGSGGIETGNTGNGIVEKEYNLLISNYIKNRLDQLGIENKITRTTDQTLTNDERINLINSYYKDNKNVIVISNQLNTGTGQGLEVIYPLRNNDKLAKLIADNIETAGGTVNKYYQLRDNTNTEKDYYDIINETPNYQTLIIKYAYVNNQNDANNLKNNYQDYAEAVVKSLADFINVTYTPPKEGNYYVVKKGDSLYKIANLYNTTVAELKNINNLATNTLQIGQVLKLPTQKEETNVTYIVKKGDTLYKIASTYKVTVDEIKKANNLATNTLQIGQSLKIPNQKTTTSQKTYTVKKGDTLYKIALQNNISVDALKKANNLTSNILSIGQVLTIPN